MFLCQARGRGLHFRASSRKPRMAYLFYPQTPCKISVFEAFHPNSTQNTTSIPTSTKPTKIKHFTTFYTIKNHHYSTLKSPQSLENKTFSRTQHKITYLIRKFHLTNHIKSNLKISQTPAKSTLYRYIKFTDNTYISKSYFLSSNKYQKFTLSHL